MSTGVRLVLCNFLHGSVSLDLSQEKGLLADSDIEEDFEIELQEKDQLHLGTEVTSCSLEKSDEH